jgi:hypothetical protein
MAKTSVLIFSVLCDGSARLHGRQGGPDNLLSGWRSEAETQEVTDDFRYESSLAPSIFGVLLWPAATQATSCLGHLEGAR